MLFKPNTQQAQHPTPNIMLFKPNTQQATSTPSQSPFCTPIQTRARAHTHTHTHTHKTPPFSPQKCQLPPPPAPQQRRRRTYTDVKRHQNHRHSVFHPLGTHVEFELFLSLVVVLKMLHLMVVLVV
jgi:hypothetical protein